MEKLDTLKKWLQEVWTNENEHTIHQIFVPKNGGSAKGLGKDQGIGPDEFVIFHRKLLSLIREVQVEIEDFSEKGDTIFAECSLQATDRETGSKEIGIKGCIVARIADGKILDANNYFDFLGLFEALGLLPKNTFASCLDGEAVGGHTEM